MRAPPARAGAARRTPARSRSRCAGAAGRERRSSSARTRARAARQHEHAVAQVERLLDVVRDEQRPCAARRRARAASHSCSSARVIESSDANGSSSSRTGLSGEQRAGERHALAHPARQLVGPGARRTRSRPKRSNSVVARAARLARRDAPCSSSASAALSSAERHGSRRSRCGISAQRRAARAVADALDGDLTGVGSSRPQISSSSVDFPQPDGPTSPSVSPRATASVTPASAATGPRARRERLRQRRRPPRPPCRLRRSTSAAPSREPSRTSVACSLRGHYPTGSKGQRREGCSPEALSQPACPRAPLIRSTRV